jgi:hypothetical protein
MEPFKKIFSKFKKKHFPKGNQPINDPSLGSRQPGQAPSYSARGVCETLENFPLG